MIIHLRLGGFGEVCGGWAQGRVSLVTRRSSLAVNRGGEGGAEWVGYQWPKVARCGALVNERTVRVVL